jgi:ubiquinone/menaquinone biosynthesis C-methylase UbiE
MLSHYNGKKVIGKAEELPFKDKNFDNVICVTVLHHCDIDKAIKEMLRVVKDDGNVIVTLLKKSNKELNYEKIDIGKDWLYLVKK